MVKYMSSLHLILAALVCLLIVIVCFIAIKRVINQPVEIPVQEIPAFSTFDPFKDYNLMKMYGVSEVQVDTDDLDSSEEIIVVEPPLRRARVVIDNHGFRIIGNVIHIINETEAANEVVEEDAERDRENETADEFFDRIVEHNDDSQNVHNSSIRKSLTTRLIRIIELNGGLKDSYEIGGEVMAKEQYLEARTMQVSYEIKKRARQYFDGLILREELTDEEANLRMGKIAIVLKKAEHGYEISMRDGKIYREDFILNQVWDRINHSDNLENQIALQVSLIDNLVDAVQEKFGVHAPVIQNLMNALIGHPNEELIGTGVAETYEPVCINGRVARYLTSLILLDMDELIAQPEKDEKEIANEAYMKASRILDRELEAYELKLPECMKTIEDIYTEIDPEKNLSQREQLILTSFENHVKKAIHDELTKDYQSFVDMDELEIIIEKAQSGI